MITGIASLEAVGPNTGRSLLALSSACVETYQRCACAMTVSPGTWSYYFAASNGSRLPVGSKVRVVDALVVSNGTDYFVVDSIALRPAAESSQTASEARTQVEPAAHELVLTLGAMPTRFVRGLGAPDEPIANYPPLRIGNVEVRASRRRAGGRPLSVPLRWRTPPGDSNAPGEGTGPTCLTAPSE